MLIVREQVETFLIFRNKLKHKI